MQASGKILVTGAKGFVGARVMEYFKDAIAFPSEILRATEPEKGVIEFVKRGIGIAPIARDFAESALASGEVVSLALSDPLPPRELYLAYSSRLPLSAAARRMLELLAEARGEA